MRDELPGSVAVVEDWPGMLRAAGLTRRTEPDLPRGPPGPAGGRHPAVRTAVLERCRETLADHLDAETSRPWTGSSTRPTRRASTGARTCSC
ncbi:hypothetical protein OJ254_06185 [Streptomyces endophytica]|uniref:Uncharacterized protein n=1 Tax=Streptomyces endophytica TaxID=2991496 RepID=A0ABY6P8E4_9ACTN|nr:hypothetical protein [Streptomyces endophytica]UZJ30081.1 hypothetical protein OJ254_06185 [Streptomyces endophytica]